MNVSILICKFNLFIVSLLKHMIFVFISKLFEATNTDCSYIQPELMKN